MLITAETSLCYEVFKPIFALNPLRDKPIKRDVGFLSLKSFLEIIINIYNEVIGSHLSAKI